MKDLADVYQKALNIHPRVNVTRHAAERLIERKIDLEQFVNVLEIVENKICVILFETELQGVNTYMVRHKGLRVPVRVIKESLSLVITTVY
jgi:hypothetical protein